MKQDIEKVVEILRENIIVGRLYDAAEAISKDYIRRDSVELEDIMTLCQQIHPTLSGLTCNHIPKFCECRFVQIYDLAKVLYKEGSKPRK